MRKLKFCLIAFILLVFSSLVMGSITNSRYFASVKITGLANIGYTIFELSEYQNTDVEGYDGNTQTLTIAPRGEKILKYKITNKENDHYNQMNLSYHLRIVDLESDSEITFQTSVNGSEYVPGAVKGIAWDGKSEDESIFTIIVGCGNNIFEQKNLRYQVVAEATSENGKVIVRRVINLNIRVFDTYNIEYELYNNGMNPEEQLTSFNLGDTVILKDPTSNTHDFMGWYDNEEYTGNPITSFSGKNENQKFFAKWQEKDMHILKVTVNEEDAKVTYSSSQTGTSETTGGFEARFVEGDTVIVTVSKENYETVTKQYIIGTEDIIDEIEIRQTYNLNLIAKALEYNLESDATIIYNINQPASISTEAKSENGNVSGLLSKVLPVGTSISVTISKSGNYETIQKTYTISSNDINETLKIRRKYSINISTKKLESGVKKDASYTYTVVQPKSAEDMNTKITSNGSGSASFSGTYPFNTEITVTVSESGYETISKTYNITTSDISDEIIIEKKYTFTFSVLKNNENVNTNIKFKYTVNRRNKDNYRRKICFAIFYSNRGNTDRLVCFSRLLHISVWNIYCNIK